MAEASREAMRRRFDNDAAEISYVYIIRDGDGRPLYVGHGRGDRVATSARHRVGRPEIVAERLTKVQARRIEAHLLRILGRRGVDPLGILVNEAPAKVRPPREYPLRDWAEASLRPDHERVASPHRRGYAFVAGLRHQGNGRRLAVSGIRRASPESADVEANSFARDDARLASLFARLELGHG